ncbi:MAG: hypothetical protein SGPRY_012219 [Prymnesium sp.]
MLRSGALSRELAFSQLSTAEEAPPPPPPHPFAFSVSALLVASRQLECALWIVIWFLMSICLTLSNKYLFTSYGLHFPLSITSFHFLLKLLFARAAMFVIGIPPLELNRTYRTLCSIGVTGMATAADVALSNQAFLFISVTYYTIVKTSVPVWILIFSLAYGLKKASVSLLGVLALILTGIALATLDPSEAIEDPTPLDEAASGPARRMSQAMLLPGRDALDALHLLARPSGDTLRSSLFATLPLSLSNSAALGRPATRMLDGESGVDDEIGTTPAAAPSSGAVLQEDSSSLADRSWMLSDTPVGLVRFAPEHFLWLFECANLLTPLHAQMFSIPVNHIVSCSHELGEFDHTTSLSDTHLGFVNMLVLAASVCAGFRWASSEALLAPDHALRSDEGEASAEEVRSNTHFLSPFALLPAVSILSPCSRVVYGTAPFGLLLLLPVAYVFEHNSLESYVC